MAAYQAAGSAATQPRSSDQMRWPPATKYCPLIRKALCRPILPTKEDFPYTVRVVSMPNAPLTRSPGCRSAISRRLPSAMVTGVPAGKHWQSQSH